MSACSPVAFVSARVGRWPASTCDRSHSAADGGRGGVADRENEEGGGVGGIAGGAARSLAGGQRDGVPWGRVEDDRHRLDSPCKRSNAIYCDQSRGVIQREKQ